MIVRSSAYVIPHTMKTLPKVISDPEICHGKPTIQGTRIMVWQILEYLESGLKAEAIYGDFPTLPKGSIESALHHAILKIFRECRSNYWETFSPLRRQLHPN